MSEMVHLFVGYDPREAAGYHTFCHSVLERATLPVAFHPIGSKMTPWWKRSKSDMPGSTDFAFARFLVPYLMDFQGHAIFADGADMVCLADIADLWEQRDPTVGAQVVQHPPYDAPSSKMWGQGNRNYPRKNWSSLVLWNCAYFPNRKLTPEWVARATGADLHRFSWLKDEQIGTLDPLWNHLVDIQHREGKQPHIAHFTHGLPTIHTYVDKWLVDKWHSERGRSNEVKPFVSVKESSK